jgi:truncated hemoglobin YjbI
MTQALADTVADVELRGFLGAAFAQLADHMRNRPEQP